MMMFMLLMMICVGVFLYVIIGGRGDSREVGMRSVSQTIPGRCDDAFRFLYCDMYGTICMIVSCYSMVGTAYKCIPYRSWHPCILHFHPDKTTHGRSRKTYFHSLLYSQGSLTLEGGKEQGASGICRSLTPTRTHTHAQTRNGKCGWKLPPA